MARNIYTRDFGRVRGVFGAGTSILSGPYGAGPDVFVLKDVALELVGKALVGTVFKVGILDAAGGLFPLVLAESGGGTICHTWGGRAVLQEGDSVVLEVVQETGGVVTYEAAVITAGFHLTGP